MRRHEGLQTHIIYIRKRTKLLSFVNLTCFLKQCLCFLSLSPTSGFRTHQNKSLRWSSLLALCLMNLKCKCKMHRFQALCQQLCHRDCKARRRLAGLSSPCHRDSNRSSCARATAGRANRGNCHPSSQVAALSSAARSSLASPF